MSDSDDISLKQASILIVDDNPHNIQLAAGALKNEGARLSFAQSGADMLEKCRANLFDLILLDVMMPEMDGYEACRKLKHLPEYGMIPVIFLTAKADKESVVEGFDAGGVDYIVKPFHGEELRMRVRNHLLLKHYRDQLDKVNSELNRELVKSMRIEEELQKSKQQLTESNQELYRRATEDPLTGLYNRRKMNDYLDHELERSSRGNDPLAFLITDIDNFKLVNDTYGHDCGDQVLMEIAGLLREKVRGQDIVARWGGEEFLILLPATAMPGALTLAENLRKAVEGREIQCESQAISVTMTFGVTEYAPGKDREELVKEADLALYQGKRAGRNRSIRFSPEME